MVIVNKDPAPCAHALHPNGGGECYLGLVTRHNTGNEPRLRRVPNLAIEAFTRGDAQPDPVAETRALNILEAASIANGGRS